MAIAEFLSDWFLMISFLEILNYQGGDIMLWAPLFYWNLFLDYFPQSIGKLISFLTDLGACLMESFHMVRLPNFLDSQSPITSAMAAFL